MQEICSDPRLFVDGASRMDVVQGILGKYKAFCASSVTLSLSHSQLGGRVTTPIRSR